MKALTITLAVLISAVLLLFFFNSESNVAEYPTDWPIVKASAAWKCSDTFGKFKNKGDEAPTNRFRYISPIYLGMELSEHVLYDTNVDPKWADIVELVATTNSGFEVVLWEEGKQLLRDRYKQGDFSCSSGWISTSSSGMNSTHIRVEWNAYSLKFAKASDGSLVMRSSYKNYGLFAFLIPYREQTVQWYRFPTAELPPS
jgi:hypothetical protein